MELTVESLVAAGVPQEVATKIVAAHKAVIEKGFIPKTRFDEVNEESKARKIQLEERDKQIAELSKFKGSAEELAAKVKEMEDANKVKDAEYKAQLEKERKVNAVKFELLADPKNLPYDVDMVLNQLKLDDIKVDEAGKVLSGFKEQRDAIKKEKAFLFKPEEAAPKKPFFRITGVEPKDGDTADKGSAGGEGFGKSLAAMKLAQSGIKIDAK
jgi:hypothetical protein